jgi:GTP pyrophosphokinase
MVTKEEFLKRISYLPETRQALVVKAYDYAEQKHAGQLRKTGEPYFIHPVNVALILTGLQLDATTLSAALLHDVCEDCDVPIATIAQEFGDEVAALVDGVTKLKSLSMPVLEEKTKPGTREHQAENLRKLLIAMAKDLRVVFIKIADRLHNMETLSALKPEKQYAIARETMDIYVPLAHRLGMWDIKWRLEDLSFMYLDPEKYHHVEKLVSSQREQREAIIKELMKILEKEFSLLGIEAEIKGRAKGYYSIQGKIDKYAKQGREFNEIYDLLAVRVIVDSIQECYHVIGLVHSKWHPVPGTFDDYIANPKPNGYQSLHTVVLFNGSIPVEIQIRTHEMNNIAEYGVAAHWRYKEGKNQKIGEEERIGWLRQLLEWQGEMNEAEDFMDSVKTDIFEDQVFVFTPKGEIKDLPKGSTPIDFAYRVHTELGNSCIGAKVNGRLVALDYQLRNGEVVEILTSKKAKGPSRDWLSTTLGYVKTNNARSKIKSFFKKQERVENIERGHEMLTREFKRLGLRADNLDEIMRLYHYDNIEDFEQAIGCGDISVQSIAIKMTAEEDQAKGVTPQTTQPKIVSPSKVTVLGTGGLLTNIAGCCHPVPGDPIIGYVTRNKGVTIHKQDCYNILREDEKSRLVQVMWGSSDAVYPICMKIEAFDRVGLLSEITALMADEKINITSLSTRNKKNGTTDIIIDADTTGISQLSRLISHIERIKGVINVERINNQ